MSYPRVEYEMTQADLDEILAACRSVPLIMVGGYAPRSPQENANDAWAALGRKMGFESMTVQPVNGKGMRFFTAVPSETPTQRAERLAGEERARKAARAIELRASIEAQQRELDELAEFAPATPERAKEGE